MELYDGVKLTCRQNGDVTVVDIEGNITLGEGVATFRDAVRKLVKDGKKKIILNMAGMGHIDSSGVAEMAEGFTMVKNSGGVLKLLRMSSRVRDLLQQIKLYRVFETFDDEAQAVASFH